MVLLKKIEKGPQDYRSLSPPATHGDVQLVDFREISETKLPNDKLIYSKTKSSKKDPESTTAMFIRDNPQCWEHWAVR